LAAAPIALTPRSAAVDGAKIIDMRYLHAGEVAEFRLGHFLPGARMDRATNLRSGSQYVADIAAMADAFLSMARSFET
jgi:hypothetical protein